MKYCDLVVWNPRRLGGPMKSLLASTLAILTLSSFAEDWATSAAKRAEGLAKNDNFAQSMLDLTHPTGNSPKTSIKAEKSLDDGSVTATITLEWKGGITSSNIPR